MVRLLSKELILTTASSQEAIIFLEAIQKQIKIVDIIADYYPGKITIRFEGSKDLLEQAIDTAKKIHQTVRGMLYPDKEGFYEYNIDFLTKMTGKTFPLKPFTQILTLQGIDNSRKDDFLFAKIDYKALTALITKIDSLLSTIPYEVATTSLRDVLTVLSIIMNQTVEQVIAQLRSIEAIAEDELKRVQLIIEPDQTIEKYLQLAK